MYILLALPALSIVRAPVAFIIIPSPDAIVKFVPSPEMFSPASPNCICFPEVNNKPVLLTCVNSTLESVPNDNLELFLFIFIFSVDSQASLFHVNFLSLLLFNINPASFI